MIQTVLSVCFSFIREKKNQLLSVYPILSRITAASCSICRTQLLW